GVQSLEVFKIAVKERILVVPLDLKGDGSGSERPDVINLVRLGLPLDAIDDSLNHEDVLAPLVRGQGPAKALGALGFAAARPDDFLDWDGRSCQDAFELFGHLGKVDLKDGFGVRPKLDLETPFFKAIKHWPRSPRREANIYHQLS